MDEPTNESLQKKIYRKVMAISKPPHTVSGQHNQQRYIFIVGFAVVTCPLLLYSQLVSSMGLFGIPLFSSLAFLIFISVVISRRGHLDLAVVIILLLFSSFPYISLVSRGQWSLEYVFIVIIWIPITMLIGVYLLDRSEAILFILSHDLVYLLTVLYHPGADILRSAFLETVLPVLSISLLIYVGSWTRQRHIDQLDALNDELNAKNKEQQIYTSLLTHDIGNDLQACLLNTEIALQQVTSDPISARQNILAAHFIGTQIGALLKVFSEPKTIMHTDIVHMIESIAKQAQVTYNDLRIVITSDEQSRNFRIMSRLLPMVFTNLFRNSATHAGGTSLVDVTLKMNESMIDIIVKDDGPGVDPSIRSTLFEKGVKGDQSKGTGMGLYLAKRIVELHNGTISLLDNEEVEGCGFFITLPCIPI